METIIICCGMNVPNIMDKLKTCYHVVEYLSQAEALVALRRNLILPSAIVIGRVDHPNDRDLEALEALEEVQRIDPALPVIISSHVNSIDTVVRLIQAGAFDYVVEPSEKEPTLLEIEVCKVRLMQSLQKAIAWRKKKNVQSGTQIISDNPVPSLVANSKAISNVIELAKKAAPTSASIMITGESGTGKECIARLIHNLSAAKNEPLVAVNCGALNDQLLASELFGHERGAFTGATMARNGLLREVGTGTLFLDEIGTISHAFQVLLLRVLEQRTARPVGGSAEYPVKARFISAANKSIPNLIQEGLFREDLWYRLNVFHISLPPLRERVEDIPALAFHFLRQFQTTMGRKIQGIDIGAMNRLEAYNWPGNVRELRNVIERAAIVCDGDKIRAIDIDLAGRTDMEREALRLQNSESPFESSMKQFEKGLIERALAQSKDNVSQAAKILGINRTTLYYRMARFGVNPKQSENK
jgi:two-component system NtrC family response regulator